jgi:hypothetical protein
VLCRPAGADCEAKVHDFGTPVGRYHHVGGLEIPVDDTMLVSVLQRIGELTSDTADTLRRPTPRCGHRVQAAALDELHSYEGHPVDNADLMHGTNVE